MKQNHKKNGMWIHVLLVTLSIIVLIAVGIGSYILIQNVFKTEESVMEIDEDSQIIAADVSIDSQAINLIYEVHNDKISQILIEILNSDINNMDYISIPGNTELKLSADIEKKFEKYDVDVDENSIRVDELTDYYDKNAFQFGQLIIGDVLGIDISYYTVMTSSAFVKYFVTDEKSFYLGKNKYDYEMRVLSDTFKTKLRQFDVQLDEIIDDSYEDILSSLNVQDKKKYIKAFEKIDVDKVYNWHIIGKEVYGRFIIDEKLTTKLLNAILNNKKEYKYTQEEYNSNMDKKLSK